MDSKRATANTNACNLSKIRNLVAYACNTIHVQNVKSISFPNLLTLRTGTALLCRAAQRLYRCESSFPAPVTLRLLGTDSDWRLLFPLLKPWPLRSAVNLDDCQELSSTCRVAGSWLLWSPLRALCSSTSCHLSLSSLLPSHYLSFPASQGHRLGPCHSFPLVFFSLQIKCSLNFIHAQAFKCYLCLYDSDSNSYTFVGYFLPFLSAISTHVFSCLSWKMTKSNSISLHGECVSPGTPPTNFPSIRLANEEERKRILYLTPPSPFPLHLGHPKYYSSFSHSKKFNLFLSLCLLQSLWPSPHS